MNAVATDEDRLIKRTLKAAVIYDDFNFAARAAALLDRVAIRADEAMKWDIKPWRLDVLQEPSLADAAFDETADADLIVVALRKTPSCPDELMSWLESWAMKLQTVDPAMMVYCPEGNAASMPLGHDLKESRNGTACLFWAVPICETMGIQLNLSTSRGGGNDHHNPLCQRLNHLRNRPTHPVIGASTNNVVMTVAMSSFQTKLYWGMRLRPRERKKLWQRK